MRAAVMEAPTYGHVNYTTALIEAFEHLRDSRQNRGERFNNINFKPDDPKYGEWSKHLFGSNCEKEQPNQAVIMVTDGVPDR